MKAVGIKLWLAGLLAVVGCSRSPYPVAPVQGRVTIDGHPMTGGKVMFAPAASGGELNAGRPAFGHIQPDGSFCLSTYGDGDGAVVGEHWVSVINVEPEAGSPAVQQAAAKAPVNQHNFRRIAFPRRTVSVVADQLNEFDIGITSQDIAKYGKRRTPDD